MPGFAGSFYLDVTLTPVLSNYEYELEIRISSTNENGIQGFFIRDPDGVIYNFGENYNVETTIMNYKSPTGKRSATTAFYLTSMVHPKGDTIFFSYSPESDYINRLGTYQHISKIYAHDQEPPPELNCPNLSQSYSDMNYLQS